MGIITHDRKKGAEFWEERRGRGRVRCVVARRQACGKKRQEEARCRNIVALLPLSLALNSQHFHSNKTTTTVDCFC